MKTKSQIDIKLIINRNDMDDLAKITQLVREGWNIIHLGSFDSEPGNNTKIIFTRFI